MFGRLFQNAIGFLVLFSVEVFAQQDSAAFRDANNLPGSLEKIRALEQFVNQFPESKLQTRANDGLFDLCLEQGDEAGSVRAATRSLASQIPQNRMNPYNRFAYALAQKSFGLDSALAWIQRAEDMAIKLSPRSVAGFQDTRAFVLYKLGKFADAEQLQRLAMKGNEDDPEFLGHLALYEKENDKLPDALRTMAKTLYLGGDQELKGLFVEWIASSEKTKAEQDKVKNAVVMSTIHSFIDTLKGTRLIAARSNAALLMADLEVQIPTAKLWSLAATNSLNKSSSIDVVVSYTQSYAFVLLAEQNYLSALKQLRSIEELVDPYDARYWLALGKAYERSGDVRGAMSAYYSGLLPRTDKQLRSALETLYSKEYGSLVGLDAALDSAKQSSTNFHPGSYGKPTTPSGKVILAELFTGADCGPCASSDIAFDALSEYYSRSAVAILEFHVHVPGPDPMTTNESWDRYKWYEGGGTPTVVIDGGEKILGGGSRVVAKNRFGVYKYAIQKVESEKPLANISLDVRMQGDDITVVTTVGRKKTSSTKTQHALHIALVERSVDYTGSNNISKHAFVVRRLFDGAMGTVLSKKESVEIVNRSINVSEVEKRIKEYLDSPTTQPSWSTRRPFTGWKSRPDTLDRSNLAIVAWVQNMNSKRILQSSFEYVPAPNASK